MAARPLKPGDNRSTVPFGLPAITRSWVDASTLISDATSRTPAGNTTRPVLGIAIAAANSKPSILGLFYLVHGDPLPRCHRPSVRQFYGECSQRGHHRHRRGERIGQSETAPDRC